MPEHDTPAPSEEPRKPASGPLRILKYVLYGLGGIVGLVVVLLLIGLLVLQSNWGAARFGDFVFGLANPYDSTETTFGKLSGTFLTRVELHDLNLTQPDGSRVVHIDTLRVRYNLLALLGGRIHLRELYLARPIIVAHQSEDGQWDALAPFLSDTTQTDTLKDGMAFQIDELRLTNGELYAEYYNPRRDSVLKANRLNVLAHDFEMADGISVRLDTLLAAFAPPDAGWVELRAGADVSESRSVHVRGLALTSDRSRVGARGRVHLPASADEPARALGFRLQARPLAFGDIAPFAPSLDPTQSVRLDATVDGTSRQMRIRSLARFDDGGSLSLNGRIAPSPGPVRYQLTARLDRFDPLGLLQGAEEKLLLQGVIQTNLAGATPQELSGVVRADLRSADYGDYNVRRANLQSRFQGGLARFEIGADVEGAPLRITGSARPFDAEISYDVAGRVERLDIGRFSQGGQRSNIDARFALEGRGVDPQTALANGSLTLAPSRINRIRLDEGKLDLALEDGVLTAGARMLFPKGRVFAASTVRFGDSLSYEVSRGRFENVDVAGLMGRPERSALNGSFSLKGRGTNPQTLDLDASIDMAPSYFGTYRLSDAGVEAAMRSGRLTTTLDAHLPQAGSFDFALETRPFDEEPLLRVTRGEFRDVNVGRLTGNPDLSTDLTGTAVFSLRGFDPSTMNMEGRLDLDPSRVNEQTITNAYLVAEMRRGRLEYNANVRLPAGEARMAGYARPLDASPTYAVNFGRFRNIDAGKFTGNPELASDLNGSFRLNGRGFDPNTLRLEARLDVAPSWVNEQLINSASLEATMRRGDLAYALAVDVPEGRARLEGAAQPLLETPTYSVTEGVFSGVDVGAITANPNLETNLNGTLRLSGRGADPATLTLDADIGFDRSYINEMTLVEGAVAADLADGLTNVNTLLRFEEGAVRADATGRFFDETPTYAVEGALEQIDLARLVRNDSLFMDRNGVQKGLFTARFNAAGSGFEPQTMTLRGRVYADTAALGDVDVDALEARFALADGQLVVDTLLLRSNFADATGSGRIALFDSLAYQNSDLRFSAEVRTLEPVRGFIPVDVLALERAHLNGRLYGRPEGLRFDVETDAGHLAYGENRVSNLKGTITGTLDPSFALEEARMNLTASNVNTAQIMGRDAAIEATYADAHADFRGGLMIDEDRDFNLAGQASLRPDSQWVQLDTLNLNLGKDHWRLLQPAVVEVQDGYRVRNFLLYADDQQIAVDGIIDPRGEQNLVLTIESVEMGPFADLFNLEGLDGVLNGRLDMTGPAADPNVAGALSMDLVSRETPVGALKTELRYEDRRFNLSAVLTHRDGSTLTAEGYLPIDLALAPADSAAVGEGVTIETGDAPAQSGINFTVRADSFSVDWLDPFLDQQAFTHLGGHLFADMVITGTFGDPQLNGEMRLQDGEITMPEFGVTYDRVNVRAGLAGNQIRLDTAAMRSGGGWAYANGVINLTQLSVGELQINANLDDFRAVDSPQYRAAVSGNITMTGSTEQPVVKGRVSLTDTDIYLDQSTPAAEVAPVQLTARDLRIVEDRFGYKIAARDTSTFVFYDALTLDMTVEMGRDMWIRQSGNPQIAIQFSGDLELNKQPNQEIGIFGTIEVIPERSYVNQFGRRFLITSGEIDFNGGPTDFVMNVETEYRVKKRRNDQPEATITLALNGRLDNPTLTLGSDPPMEQTDIVSYIATGRPADQSLQLGGGGGGGGGAFDSGAALATGQLASIIEGVAAEGLGLDVIEIQTSGFNTELVAGKYVTPKLYLGIQQPITVTRSQDDPTRQNNAPQVTLEYEVIDWLLLRLSGGSSALQGNLLWEYSY